MEQPSQPCSQHPPLLVVHNDSLGACRNRNSCCLASWFLVQISRKPMFETVLERLSSAWPLVFFSKATITPVLNLNKSKKISQLSIVSNLSKVSNISCISDQREISKIRTYTRTFISMTASTSASDAGGKLQKDLYQCLAHRSPRARIAWNNTTTRT